VTHDSYASWSSRMKKYLVAAVSLLFLLLCVTGLFAAEHRVVRVGAFNYYPGIFKDNDGVVKGFYVDALADIARRENIRFEYVYGSWSEGLERIKTGDVDVLTSVAYTPVREEYLDYARTPLLTVWGELYVPLASGIDGIREVQGKKIAVMKGDFNASYFINLVNKFDIDCEFVELPGFEDVFKAVASKKVDAGVVNNTFGVAKQKEYGLRSTGVVFNPFDIFFAVRKGENQKLLELLDSYLTKWRHQSDSPYKIARQKWLHGNSGNTHVIPRWLVSSVTALGVLVLAAIVFIALLKRQVRRATEQIRQRKAQLRENAETVKLLLDSTEEAIYGQDMNGACTFCNAACLRLLGYQQPEQLLGRNMHSLIHHTHDDGTPFDVSQCPICIALHQGEEAHADDELLWRSDGTGFAAEYWAHPVRRDGEIVGSVLTFLDITERKRVEQDLQDKNTELERFTYSVSHDLKSPLVTIQSYAGMIRQDLASDNLARAQDDLGRIEAAAAKMSSMLNALLDLSRVGRMMNEPSPIDMNRLVKDCLAQLAGPLKQKHIEVVLQPDLPALLGDSQRLFAVLQNLIENAIKYMGDQVAPRIEIGTRKEGVETVFFVGDNGVGIAPTLHEKVFGLFSQLDGKSDGTGIGLALVRRIIEVHGGRVWVESEGGGKGSRFCFVLPVQFIRSDAATAETEKI